MQARGTAVATGPYLAPGRWSPVRARRFRVDGREVPPRDYQWRLEVAVYCQPTA